ncbi:1-deoxyxylulose-5-phosphate synthase, thiamine-requiring, FAD-requiring [Endomicrobium proavitum]|uniref:1-deoxy-D-xylulose-5-phosphate synthase n=1 Tax=Endomicrobium proavitum TaxID=1408281 RepID=A0A0G3WI85_9BACT|nr:1-deoxy-D-xylulose-5-phosphate synthase [Endomicrobium proavitum]AKL97595.1 1-deoxyxylulose-5-phosphate synthase, thiamine-requiring, FAD-requiring [Endomicrobium proavitum]
MKILDKVNSPEDLKKLTKDELPALAKEVREEIISSVSKTGGHLASSLGAVDLTIALHYAYNAPKDKIIWDVGHQAYAHKILTGRKDKFKTLRTHGGLSGFPKRSESPYDAFGAGHSSTSISAALGFAVARDLQKEKFEVVSVIGDGSMTGGLAFEGLQNAGHLKKDMLVILNDNQMFISQKVGAVAGYFAKLLTGGKFKKVEEKVMKTVSRFHSFGSPFGKLIKRVKVMLFPGMLFEEMGFTYIGPVQGHNIDNIITILTNIKTMKGPVLLHVITKKGKGYEPAEENPEKFHGVGKFDAATGKTVKSNGVTYTKVFSDALVKLAAYDNKIVAVTAAMPEGTGLDKFAKSFPKRYFDVGIAEEHAVTFAAGMAADGLKPVCAIYSTFMQRALDNIIHDVALQNLPVVFALDRAGLVGEDGGTHHGAFDFSYLKFIPNLIVMAPSDEDELSRMLKTALQSGKPCALRYPRGAGAGVEVNNNATVLRIGKAKVLSEGKDVCILAIGNHVSTALAASKILKEKNIEAAVINMRFLKPFDEEVIFSMLAKTNKFITVEENALSGGFGESVKSVLSGTGAIVKSIGLPDKFIEHGNIRILREKYGLTPENIAETAVNAIHGKK